MKYHPVVRTTVYLREQLAKVVVEGQVGQSAIGNWHGGSCAHIVWPIRARFTAVYPDKKRSLRPTS
jgi:hypothetical protein